MGTRTLQGTKVTIKLTTIVRNAMTFNTSRLASGPVDFSSDVSLNNGVSANEANRAWEHEITISSGGTFVIDLFDFAGIDGGAGSGRDITGQVTTPFEEIVGIFIQNANGIAVSGNLEIEPDGTNGWDPIGIHTVALGGALAGQGVLAKFNPAEVGFALTDASSHRIKLTANGADVLVRIAVLGRHDDNESSSSSSSASSSSSSISSSSSSVSSVSSSSSSSISSSSSSSISSSSSSSVSSSSSQS